MTKIINLFGGACTGKSVLAADLFSALKKQGVEVELAQEYVKRWAWTGKKVASPLDQLYIFAKQVKLESELIGKVDVVVTDSPSILSAMYEKEMFGTSIVEKAAVEYQTYLTSLGVQTFNFVLKREFPFNPKGRYSTTTPERLDEMITSNLKHLNYDFIVVETTPQNRCNFILNRI